MCFVYVCVCARPLPPRVCANEIVFVSGLVWRYGGVAHSKFSLVFLVHTHMCVFFRLLFHLYLVACDALAFQGKKSFGAKTHAQTSVLIIVALVNFVFEFSFSFSFFAFIYLFYCYIFFLITWFWLFRCLRTISKISFELFFFLVLFFSCILVQLKLSSEDSVQHYSLSVFFSFLDHFSFSFARFRFSFSHFTRDTFDIHLNFCRNLFAFTPGFAAFCLFVQCVLLISSTLRCAQFQFLKTFSINTNPNKNDILLRVAYGLAPFLPSKDIICRQSNNQRWDFSFLGISDFREKNRENKTFFQ